MSEWASRYIERFNFVLTYSKPGCKGPRHEGWNTLEKAIRTPDQALRFWRDHPDYGIGGLLGYSDRVSFDVDSVEHTRTVLAAFDIELDEVTRDVPTIIGNPVKFRCMFQAPAGVELKHRTALWPKQDNPHKGFALFEWRAGAVSDALPPTIHKDTRQHYRWAIPPMNGFPPLPQCLLTLWTDWDNTNAKIRSLCPWAPPMPNVETSRQARPRPRPPDAPSVIAEFNKATDLAELLETYGYRRQGKRFLAPDSHHSAGIVLLESGRVFSHHAGDLLGGGRARDAFDVYTTIEHNGDVRAATRAAAQKLGLHEGRHGR